jgi:predicted AAA+ superfamily ATPase
MVRMRRRRIYDAVLTEHLRKYRQMAFLAGPRQVGKTTLVRERGVYLNWDDQDDRAAILAGPNGVVRRAKLDRLSPTDVVIAFDELHKYGRWKSFLKGFFDTWENRARVLVTGSSRLDVFRRGGDSLMGRYFLYHVHPFSVGEAGRAKLSLSLTQVAKKPDEKDWNALWEHGGFPEPFLRRDARFTRRWRQLRRQQLLREDVRDLTRLHELSQLEMLATLLRERSGGAVVYSNLANDIQVSVDTVRRWVELLATLHVGFLARPWFRNVAKSLRKEPKWYEADWAVVQDEGARWETMVACHLQKAVQFWQDLGLGAFELRYLRDKEKREVDFLVVRDKNPWLMIEAKLTDSSLPAQLEYFQRQTGAPHAISVVRNLDYVQADALGSSRPMVVPGRTLLSQLP